MNEQRKPRVGVLGAGQLALMLAEAGNALGIDVLCAGRPGDCAGTVAPILPVDLKNAAAVAAFAQTVDLVTVESENIDRSVLEGLPLYPSAHAVGIAQDRLLEKRFFASCGIEVAPFAPVDSLASLQAAVAQLGTPSILKTRRMGYDGKGQIRLHAAPEAPATEASAAWHELHEVPCILEGMVPFDAEVSCLGVRSRTGEVAFYPLVRNVHRDGILRFSAAPFEDHALQAQAEAYLRTLLERLDYVGVLAVEFFVVGGRLVANEMAPRVHNSGHWTIEGSATSQFANHLRAILGWPLGSTASEPTVLLNCIGSVPPLAETQQWPSIHRHDYGKSARPGRKVGHLTLPASDTAAIAHWRTQLERED